MPVRILIGAYFRAGMVHTQGPKNGVLSIQMGNVGKVPQYCFHGLKHFIWVFFGLLSLELSLNCYAIRE